MKSKTPKREPRGSKGSSKWVWLGYLVLGYLVVCLFYYFFFLTAKYAELGHIYDKEKKEFRQPYKKIGQGLAIGLFVLMMPVALIFGAGFPLILLVLTGLVWLLMWGLDRIAAVLYRKTDVQFDITYPPELKNMRE